MKSFTIEGGEKEVNEVVSKLRFISKMKEGEKLDVQTLRLYENCATTALHRTFIARNESRERTLEFIRESTQDAFNLTMKYLTKQEHFYKDVGSMIIKAIQEIKPALVGLKKTYEDDRMFVAKVETFEGTLDTKILDLKRQLEIGSEVKPKKEKELSKPETEGKTYYGRRR